MLRTFNVVISKVKEGFVVSTEDLLLAKGHVFESVHDILEVLRNVRGHYEKEAQEYALIRVFMKDENNPVQVF
jgi:hypothetical protein